MIHAAIEWIIQALHPYALSIHVWVAKAIYVMFCHISTKVYTHLKHKYLKGIEEKFYLNSTAVPKQMPHLV